MRGFFSRKMLWVLLFIVVAVSVFVFSTRRPAIDFNTEVKPIFNKKCISCHGGVKKKAGFSLLFRSEAMANTESGKPAIIPGDADKSELIRRLTLKDPEERMPYKHDALSEHEISILRRWVNEGAKWGDHWAYIPVTAVKLPSSGNEWIRNDVDQFIFEKMEEEKLKPSPGADKATLLRRVSLDLTGLPAPQHLATAFLQDETGKAYERLVDSLLASPAYGERWTALWLDLARYADTKGYERDDKRTIWRYRDWLIKAFNEDKSYDKFITEQLAGDLFPEPTDDQYIATAFHRNTMTNDEGGTDNEEFRTSAVLDRVNTTWEALMGTSFACVQCHSHPYDPFKHEEYYKFLAFFNNTRDEDTFEDYPLLRDFNDSLKKELSTLVQWVEKNSSPARAKEIRTFVRTWQPVIHSLTADSLVNSELNDTKWLSLRYNGMARFRKVDLQGKDQFIYRYRSNETGGTFTIHLDSPDGPVLKTIHIDTSVSYRMIAYDLPPVIGVHDLYFTYSNPRLKGTEKSGIQFDWLSFTNELPGKGRPGYEENHKRYWSLLNVRTRLTPVMIENPASLKRETHVFERGNWLVKGELVEPDVPQSLNPLPQNAPRNRMGLALWLTDKKNPLTSRTMVNRVWEQLFGTGLVETLEDLGTQGASPTHKELLDHLSYRFMNDMNWSIKKLLKELVLSATYQQDSRISPGLYEKDPYNKFYARGPRVRLPAEQLRDQALFISGLLSRKMYGPGVMPYQPPGIWLSPYSGESWKQSSGEDQYRRGVYTYFKRTAPYPSMMTFDATTREVCTSRRIRTNTPLQALATLNDEAFLEMARHFAYRMQREGGKDLKAQISKGYEMALYKTIPKTALATLEKLYNQSYITFKADPYRSCEMIGVMDEHNNPETAALVVVANVILNMDELIMKN
jgi:hypothetical protein